MPNILKQHISIVISKFLSMHIFIFEIKVKMYKIWTVLPIFISNFYCDIAEISVKC